MTKSDWKNLAAAGLVASAALYGTYQKAAAGESILPEQPAQDFPLALPGLPASLMVPEALRPLFAGAAVGNTNTLKFAADGSKVESVAAYVRVSNLDCKAGRAAFKAALDASGIAAQNPEAALQADFIARQLFENGALEIVNFNFKRGELGPEFSDLDEESRAQILTLQELMWPADWPDQAQANITLECRADTFGLDH